MKLAKETYQLTLEIYFSDEFGPLFFPKPTTTTRKNWVKMIKKLIKAKQQTKSDFKVKDT